MWIIEVRSMGISSATTERFNVGLYKKERQTILYDTEHVSIWCL